VLVYRDRSDGFLFTTVVEASFACCVGAQISLDSLRSPLAVLFNKELRAIFHIKESDTPKLSSVFVGTDPLRLPPT
jgi:phosphoribosylformylglycinamidine (FGAM) synthase-like enzyme